MNDRELGKIGWVGVISIVAAFWFLLLMGGCAADQPKPPPVEVQCGSSNYEKCTDKCASQGRGGAFIVENATDVACFCRKPGEGT